MSDRNHEGDRHGPAEPPRSEPEIIPPRHTGGRGRIFVSVDEHSGAQRVYVAQPGPFTIILALAVLALIALVMLIVLLSVALIWIPVVIIMVTVLVLSLTFSWYWQRFRNWIRRR